MNCYQILYTSSIRGIDGRPGLGIRVLTEETPKEVIKMFISSGVYRYSSGKFTLGHSFDKDIAENPARIYEYPQTYFHIVAFDEKNKKYHILVRSVYTGYDFAYFNTNQVTRPGNVAAHAFIFDEFPGKNVFELLYGNASEGAAEFLPKDWTLSFDNEELKRLEVGEPEQFAVGMPKFGTINIEIPEESFDVLFAYRASSVKKTLEGAKMPLVVSTKAEDASKICAGVMKLLSKDLAEKSTFAINYQQNGIAKEYAIIFVNEYYSYIVPQTLVFHADILGGTRQIDEMEALWRPIVKKAVEAGDFERVERLVNWIFSDFATTMVGESMELNQAVFDYCMYPENFTLDKLATVNGLLPALSKAIAADNTTADRLIALLSEKFVSAASLQDYLDAIKLAQSVESVGIGIAEVVKVAQGEFTAFVLADNKNLLEAVEQCGLFTKYIALDKIPALEVLLPQFATANESSERVFRLSDLLQPSAEERVKLYVKLINAAPDSMKFYLPLFDKDRSVADRVDYLKEFKEYHANATFAGLFFSQIKRTYTQRPVREMLALLEKMQKCNTEFGKLLFNDMSIYPTLYGEYEKMVLEDEAKEISYRQCCDEIQKNVLDVIPEDMSSRKDWQLLKDVLAAEKTDNTDLRKYWELALKMDNTRALTVIISDYIPVMDKDDIKRNVAVIKEKQLLTDKRMLEIAAGIDRERVQRKWLKVVARVYGYKYDQIAAYAVAFGLENPGKFKEFMKEHFKKEYRSHWWKLFFGKIKGQFSKKTQEADEETIEPKAEKKEKRNKKKNK
ncbi:MAG: hypothetical protein ACI3ZQ_03790 [Candidatus Cryptobacteroides sp.]